MGLGGLCSEPFRDWQQQRHTPSDAHCPWAPAGESGVGSGVRREWLRLLMGHFLDGRSGLLASADGGRTWQPSVDARLQEDHLTFFHILGETTGLEESVIDVRGWLAPQGQKESQ